MGYYERKDSDKTLSVSVIGHPEDVADFFRRITFGQPMSCCDFISEENEKTPYDPATPPPAWQEAIKRHNEGDPNNFERK